MYVGSHATHVIRVLDAVPPDPALVQQAIAICVADAMCAPGDPDGVISGGTLYTGISNATLPNGTPNPIPPSIPSTAIQSAGFFPRTSLTTTNADSKHNSLQAQKVTKQFARGLLLVLAYTWSHAYHDSNVRR